MRRIALAGAMGIVLIVLSLVVATVGNPVRAWGAARAAREYMSCLKRRDYPAVLGVSNALTRRQLADRVYVLEKSLPRLDSYSMRWIKKVGSSSEYDVLFKVASDRGPTMRLRVEREGDGYVVSFVEPPGI
jgi:hypothetical protein